LNVTATTAWNGSGSGNSSSADLANKQKLEVKTFLEYVAEDLIRKHGSDLSRVTVVFPNKRASLFLNSFLSRLSDKPMWSPKYVTISELFRAQSTLVLGDPLKLVCELHKSFVTQTGMEESLDHFYGWGELLLADFDDIDKNMADADTVLANIGNIHELDSVDYLTSEQKAIVRKFFSNFTDSQSTILKERFLKLWSRLASIYHDFNDRIKAQGLAYEGALFRDAVSRPLHSLQSPLYIFVGFNLLQRVELQLFSALMKEGRARFYWDYDNYYMDSNEAGHFIGQYLGYFPNELDRGDDSIYANFTRPKTIRFVGAPTDNVQSRYVSSWLRERPDRNGLNTAVVLCDENLLPMVIQCFPSTIEKANVTLGYPLGQSPVASLVTHLFSLHILGYDPRRDRYRLRYVNALLRHPYVACLSSAAADLQHELTTKKVYYPSAAQLSVDEGTTLLFGSDARMVHDSSGNETLLQWLSDVIHTIAVSPSLDTAPSPVFIRESLFRTYTLLNRLLTLVHDGDLAVDVMTLNRLVTQLIQSSSVPFHGEPAEGLQVMGVLETRNLDFDHLLILSCNEGNMPRGVDDTSFIPYSLRKAYGLTTSDHKVSIYSYYFHRLLQRATDITLVYNNSASSGQGGEMSRFMLQMMVEAGMHRVEHQNLRASQAYTPFRPDQREKTAEVMQRLVQRFGVKEGQTATTALLTPTAINKYLRCPLIFYYTYVYNLREPDVDEDDVIDNRIFGNIFHEASRIVYSRLVDKRGEIRASDIDAVLKDRVTVQMAVDKAMQSEFFHLPEEGAADHHRSLSDLNGLQIINREVITHYLCRLLETDRQQAPFSILGLETDIVAPLQTKYIHTTIGGRIDRLDCIHTDNGDCVRVVDYKTGSNKPRPLPDVESIFKPENIPAHSDYYLQTFLYACIVRSHRPEPVAPALLFIQHNSGENSNPILKFGKDFIGDVAPHATTFSEHLHTVVDEMFCPDVPFLPTPDKSRCANCPYKMLCSI